jgi:hypothetical protein
MLNILAIVAGILTSTLSPQATTMGASAPPPPTEEIGDPCNPETYSGPYRCVPDENSVSGYAIAN